MNVYGMLMEKNRLEDEVDLLQEKVDKIHQHFLDNYESKRRIEAKVQNKPYQKLYGRVENVRRMRGESSVEIEMVHHDGYGDEQSTYYRVELATLQLSEEEYEAKVKAEYEEKEAQRKAAIKREQARLKDIEYKTYLALKEKYE